VCLIEELDRGPRIPRRRRPPFPISSLTKADFLKRKRLHPLFSVCLLRVRPRECSFPFPPLNKRPAEAMAADTVLVVLIFLPFMRILSRFEFVAAMLHEVARMIRGAKALLGLGDVRR